MISYLDIPTPTVICLLSTDNQDQDIKNEKPTSKLTQCYCYEDEVACKVGALR